jgi:hypothetical protein
MFVLINANPEEFGMTRNLAAAAAVAVGLWGSATIASAQAEAVGGATSGAVCTVNATLTGQALVIPACLGQAGTLNQTFDQLR